MPRKTQGVYEFVTKVLDAIPEPYGEDITEDVFLEIYKQPNWRRQYDELVDELSEDVVNQWIGRYTKQITGLKTVSQVEAKRSKIIGSYTKLHS